MSRMFTVSYKNIGVTAVQDLIEITAPTTKPVRIHGWVLSQSTEVGDAQEEGLILTTNRGVGATTSGSGGTTPIAANPIDDGDAAWGGTIDRNNTTQMAAGSGSLEELEVFAWNVRVPLMMIYTPEIRPFISAGNRWTLELETAPVDSISVSLTVWFEELG